MTVWVPPSASESARRLGMETAPLLATAPPWATVRGLETETEADWAEGSSDSVTVYRDRMGKGVVVSALLSAEGSSHCQEGRFPVAAPEQLSPAN